MTVQIDIAVHSELWENQDLVGEVADQAVRQVLKSLGFDDVVSELSILLTDDMEIKSINAQWRKIDKATNVLSFPAMDIKPEGKPGPLLGDIILAFETIAREAQEEAKSFNHHLTHLIIHGLLHLLGYDHENDTDANVMENLEIAILAKLFIANPYIDKASEN